LGIEPRILCDAVSLSRSLLAEQESDMGSNLDTVREWQNLAADDVAGRGVYLSDDFVSVDAEGNVVLTKESWTGMFHMLLASFPDWRYVTSNLRQEGDAVLMTGHFEGKFTGDLDMSAMGMGVIPATGKDIVWDDTDQKITVVDGKVAKFEPHGHAGGMGSFLKGLGVDLPAG
jgi:hypothetical protein